MSEMSDAATMTLLEDDTTGGGATAHALRVGSVSGRLIVELHGLLGEVDSATWFSPEA